MPIEIREASPNEHDQTGQITADAYREFVTAGNADWQRYLDHIADVAGRADRTVILVAVEDGRILGSSTLELDGRVEPEDDGPLGPHEAHIRMLGVAPDARGRGIARMLMVECESRARAAGRTLMTLNTTHLMKIAQKMYESMGYERGPDRTFPDGFVLLSYSKTL
jgi:ribosomal protein S18 acetylase RimI-like enzyme